MARSYHRLLAYKDEYEVARLIFDADARAEIAATATGKVRYHLHPPALRSLGLSRKLTFGPWFDPVLRGLARGKRLRGTVFDPFRWPEVRRTERRLPSEYRAGIERMLAQVDGATLDRAVAIADLPDIVRGYEHLKQSRADEFSRRFAHEVREF